MKNFLKKTKDRLLDLIYPEHIKCIFCDNELRSGDVNETCLECYKVLPFIFKSCPKCGASVDKDNTGVCNSCKRNNRSFEKAISVFDYTDNIVKLIHTVKFAGQSYPLNAMAEYMYEKLATANFEIDYITYVPLHPIRKKERTFDQAEELATRLSKKTNIPLIKLVDKVVNNPPQAKLSYELRAENIKDVYKFVDENKKAIKGKNILLIDDVMSTGLTAGKVCEIILANKSGKCYVLTFARALM